MHQLHSKKEVIPYARQQPDSADVEILLSFGVGFPKQAGHRRLRGRRLICRPNWRRANPHSR